MGVGINMTKKKTKELAEVQNFKQVADIKEQLSKAQMDFIQKTIAPSLTENEIVLFLYRAYKAGLDPLNGEMIAYAVEGKRGRQVVMFTTRDGKRVSAYRTGKLEYVKTEPVYVDKEGKRVDFWQGGNLVGAIAKGKRTDSEQVHEHSVRFAEYDQGNFIWNNKPETMIKKVAESQLLSMMFPRELGGIYDESEDFRSAGVQPEEGEVVEKDDKDPANEAQLQALNALDIEFDEKITKGEAKSLLKKLDLTKKKK